MDLRPIIEGCKQNDRRSQEKLYKQFFNPMMYMCLRYIKDKGRAVEIINDGFVKVFSRIHQYEYRGSFEGWVRRIVYHCLADSLKKDANYLKFMVFEEHDQREKHKILDKLYEEDILKLIEKIPPASGDVFLMYAVQGYNHKEIAELKGISIGTSKWHLSEARKKLQALIIENYQSSHAG